jgi:hypothetical protein
MSIEGSSTVARLLIPFINLLRFITQWQSAFSEALAPAHSSSSTSSSSSQEQDKQAILHLLLPNLAVAFVAHRDKPGAAAALRLTPNQEALLCTQAAMSSLTAIGLWRRQTDTPLTQAWAQEMVCDVTHHLVDIWPPLLLQQQEPAAAAAAAANAAAGASPSSSRTQALLQAAVQLS